MRRLHDEGGNELKSIVEQLLREDVDITVREIARRHSQLKHPSAFSRNAERMAVIAHAQKKQAEARAERGGHPTAKQTMDAKNRRIEELEGQVRALVASHAACIRAVMIHGGMAGLERFWADYKAIADTVHSLEAMPPSADVVKLKPKG